MGRRHGPPGGQRARQQGTLETPGPSRSPRMRRAGRCKATAALLPLPLPRPRPWPLVAEAGATPTTAQAGPLVLMTKRKTTQAKTRHKKNA